MGTGATAEDEMTTTTQDKGYEIDPDDVPFPPLAGADEGVACSRDIED